MAQSKYLTIVYKGIPFGDKARELCSHPQIVAASWSNALEDRDDRNKALKKAEEHIAKVVRERDVLSRDLLQTRWQHDLDADLIKLEALDARQMRARVTELENERDAMAALAETLHKAAVRGCWALAHATGGGLHGQYAKDYEELSAAIDTYRAAINKENGNG